LELRLLTDASFVEEFDVIVDEITDQYVRNELTPNERKQVEQHFLEADERRKKAAFASVLIEHAAAERGAKAVVHEKPSLRERFLAFWQTQGLGFRVASAMATILIVAGVTFLYFSGTPRSAMYTTVELTISQADRGEGAQAKSVKLTPGTDILKTYLRLPDELQSQGKTFRVESFDGKRVFQVTEQTPEMIAVEIPKAELAPGSYGLRLFVMNPDGTEQRVPGTYSFTIN
jgi:hypothetical protein